MCRAIRVLTLVCVVSCVLCQWCVVAVGYQDVHEKIQYHLSELKKGVQEMIARRIHKRSASPDYDAIIYRSLTSFCSQLNSPNKSAYFDGQLASNSSISHPDGRQKASSNPAQPSSPRVVSDWSGPDVFPVKVEAERFGDNVSVVFHVIHTAPAYVVRANSLDYARIPIDHPAASSRTTLQSVVKITVDSHVCQDEAIADDVQADFGFSLQQDSPYNVFASLDICMFDKVWNDTWHTTSGVFTQDPPLPRFQIFPDPGDEIIIKKGSNVTVQVEVQLFSVQELRVTAYIWDRRQYKLLKSNLVIGLRHYNDVGVTVNQYPRNSTSTLLSAEVVEETMFNVTEEFARQGYRMNITAKLNITVDTSNGKRSGKLMFFYTWREPEFYNRPIVRFLQVSREIRLRLPQRQKVFPSNMVDIHKPSPYECDDKGIKYYPKSSRNCTIACHAFGTDIERIVLNKVNPYRAPVRSTSYVIGNSALAMVDMGPASPAIDGSYKCIVFTASGKRKRQELKLFTSYFTSVTNMTLHEFNNGSTKLVCTSYGVQPLNITMEGFDRDGNTEDLLQYTNYNPPESVLGDVKNLTLLVDTDRLRYPMDNVRCRAEGERGTDVEAIFLSSVISRYSLGPPSIDQMPNATFIQNNGNGTMTVGCSATGQTPMTVRILLGSSDRIDNLPEVTRMETETDGRVKVNLIVPIPVFHGKSSWVRCYASNFDQEDEYEFLLHHFTSLSY